MASEVLSSESESQNPITPYMPASAYALLLVAVLWFSGCSRSDNPANAKPATAAAPVSKKYETLADVPPDLQRNAEKFGGDLERSIRQRNLPELRAAFNVTAIVDGICDGVNASGQRLEQFKSGMARGMRTGVDQVADMWSKDDAKYKRVVIYKGEVAARFRFVDKDSGISMLDLVLQTNRQGNLAIANFCNHAMGYDMVEQSRQVAAPILAELDQTFLERLVNNPGVSLENMKKFSGLTQKLRAGDFAGTIAGYKELPPELRQTMAATAIYITALQRGNDMNAYKAALKEAAARFKAVNFQFMLVDVYALDKDYDKAVSCVDAFMTALERDAALLALKSILLNAKGDVTAARASLREAFQMEPDCLYAHSKGLDVLLAAKDFPAVRDSMVFLEKHGGYNFKNHLNDKVWTDFRKAPESAAWR